MDAAKHAKWSQDRKPALHSMGRATALGYCIRSDCNMFCRLIAVCLAGPGAFDFKQGDTNGTIFWKVVRHFLKEPSTEQVACQAPKPIILDTGSVHVPYEWCALFASEPE